MAIHPYPVELESEAVLRDGTRVATRPMRPEDAELEKRFFDRELAGRGSLLPMRVMNSPGDLAALRRPR
jgi:hypothetical protein